MIDKTLLDRKLTEDLIEVADQLSYELENTLARDEHEIDRDRIQELLSDWVCFKDMTRHLIDRGMRFSKVSNPFESHRVVERTFQNTLH